MYEVILLAVALQKWERYSAHALAARDVAVALAKGAGRRLHVLSVYDYEFATPSSGFSPELAARLREEQMQRTDSLMRQKLDEFVAPLKAAGLEVNALLRVGSPRNLIVQTATHLNADVLVIGSHSKRGLFDITLGGTAQYVSRHAPCTVVLVTPKRKA
ncbi:MAG: hypothetical protein KatS3mg131_1541 [Candidatus Tectimicrobiota bacterium]|nr:MAG: hypothetical protein KatS3mg131_1541 [Candidatus Tectomicrobia bacterium]